MGMFSYIKYGKNNLPLPLPEELKDIDISTIEFQTKDLDNCLETNIIENNELFEKIEKFKYEYYTKEELAQPDHKPWDVVKSQTLIEERTEKRDFHGKLCFYENITINEDEGYWLEFDCYFIYGKLDKIVLSEQSKKLPNRKKEQEAMFKKWEDKVNSIPYKLKKNLGWFWFWRKVSNMLYRISRFFSHLQMLVNKIS